MSPLASSIISHALAAVQNCFPTNKTESQYVWLEICKVLIQKRKEFSIEIRLCFGQFSQSTSK